MTCNTHLNNKRKKESHASGWGPPSAYKLVSVGHAQTASLQASAPAVFVVVLPFLLKLFFNHLIK